MNAVVACQSETPQRSILTNLLQTLMSSLLVGIGSSLVLVIVVLGLNVSGG